ncbi:hypothetical protein D9M70_650160 [compost metagenome]
MQIGAFIAITNIRDAFHKRIDNERLPTLQAPHGDFAAIALTNRLRGQDRFAINHETSCEWQILRRKTCKNIGDISNPA